MVDSENSVISGGTENRIISPFSVIGGGKKNLIFTASDYSTISGGNGNTCKSEYGTISGGIKNEIPRESKFATVSGGTKNTAAGKASIVVGGKKNQASGDNSIAMGKNAIADKDRSFVINLNEKKSFKSTEKGQFAINGKKIVLGIKGGDEVVFTKNNIENLINALK